MSKQNKQRMKEKETTGVDPAAIKIAKDHLPVIRELIRSAQALEALSEKHIRTLGLTPPQFDIIATLGNTEGMRLKELGEKTLCTKGTLTGIIDRLEEKKLVRRIPSPTDGRSQIVQLTPAGVETFETVFPSQLTYMGRLFAALDAKRMALLKTELLYFRHAIEKGSTI